MRMLPPLYINVPALRPGTPGGYALALVSVGVATVLRLAVDPFVAGVPFATFWPAVIITALISGIGAGLFCVVLSTAAADLFVIMPHLSLYIENRADVSDLLLFLVLACFCVILITEMRGAIEREQAERTLRESKERLQLALDTAQIGWWQYDPRRRVASGDARFKQIYDVTADEIPLEDIKKLVHPDDAERFWADRLKMLDPAGPLRSTHEYRVRRRDGTVRWVQVSWLTYLEGARGELWVASVVGTVFDITERKQREERDHLLLMEVNHRSKNLINVVNAIAHQTATKDPEDFIERFSDRMQALSANQDVLVRNEWKGVEIKGLVRAQLAHFADLVGSRISVEGPRLRVKAGAAQAIGLALHELATNAGKYGALSTDVGRVDICWRTDGETFTMSWTEREGPPVSAPQRRGFGTIVMKAMAERSVDGAVDLDYAPSGLTWRLTSRAANALEPSRT
jgi:PAS domain S-box-containing protein